MTLCISADTMHHRPEPGSLRLANYEALPLALSLLLGVLTHGSSKFKGGDVNDVICGVFISQRQGYLKECKIGDASKHEKYVGCALATLVASAAWTRRTVDHSHWNPNLRKEEKTWGKRRNENPRHGSM
ncbi:hypothetical protein SESBI_50916 [Sesbania bispinosa]|nr:hypothetical protein SESBI_50916 [Sesbania bispinosa]